MESLTLQSSKFLSKTQNCQNNSLKFSDAGLIKQVGFAKFRRHRKQKWGVTVAISGRNEGGFQVPPEGSSREQQNQEDINEEKTGLVLVPHTDHSGSIVAFQSVSQSGQSIAVASKDNGSTVTSKGNGVVTIAEKERIEENREQEERERNTGENERTLTKVAFIKDKDLEEEGGLEGESKTLAKVIHSIVFVSSEAAPYSKTGGLGDVCGSLPISLASRGHRVMVVSPRYMHGTAADKVYAGAFDANCRIKVHCFEGEQEVAFFHQYRDGVDWVFVDHPAYHRPGNPYGDSFGAFGDNQFRFTLLCHAACEAPLVLPLGGFNYGDKCLFIVNDWHAGLVPVLLAAKYRPYGVYKDARSIVVIHNLSHQGVEPGVTFSNLGLPPQWYGALEWVFPEWARAHELDKGEAVNILKGAIVTADRILTVSQGYAWEITTVEGGYGLHEILSSRKFVLNGITNGIDMTEWDPSSDKHTTAHYSIKDLSGKVQCKIDLQKELGLPVRPDCPLIGFIGRLDYQKGLDLIQAAAPELMQEDIQFVMLGSGDSQYENWMRAVEATYRPKFRGWVGFNVPISHRITAGCDILLMPSRFEPCGLNQLYAMRYGTIPVVHATGGLRETVETFNPFADGGSGSGTGWAFSPLTKDSMLAALRNAIKTYREYKGSWVGLMKRGMERDYSWEYAASQYEQVFEWAFVDPPYVR